MQSSIAPKNLMLQRLHGTALSSLRGLINFIGDGVQMFTGGMSKNGETVLAHGQ